MGLDREVNLLRAATLRSGLVAMLWVLAGCAASDTAPVPVDDTVPGVGSLPGERTVEIDRMIDTSTTLPSVSVAVRPGDLDLPTVGEEVLGNRVIVIGDSILASTAPRFGGTLCEVLVEAGWSVEIDAEPGRFIAFADKVLDQRLAPSSGVDWDTAVLFFGSNFSGDLSSFEAALDELLERLERRPVILLTVTEFQDNRQLVNEVIRSRGDSQVRIIDWALITEAEPGLLAGDGLHLSAAGKNRIVTELALALGTSPTLSTDGEGQCLPTSFTNDVLPTTVPD